MPTANLSPADANTLFEHLMTEFIMMPRNDPLSTYLADEGYKRDPNGLLTMNADETKELLDDATQKDSAGVETPLRLIERPDLAFGS